MSRAHGLAARQGSQEALASRGGGQHSLAILAGRDISETIRLEFSGAIRHMNDRTIDEVTLWLSDRLLQESESDADRLILDRLRAGLAQEPLRQSLDVFDRPPKEQAGQFGIDAATSLLVTLVLPAIYSFIKSFAAKFLEGAASSAGKLTTETLTAGLRKSFSAEAAPADRQKALAQLETAFAARAASLKLTSASYEPFLQALRSKPELLI